MTKLMKRIDTSWKITNTSIMNVDTYVWTYVYIIDVPTYTANFYHEVVWSDTVAPSIVKTVCYTPSDYHTGTGQHRPG